MNHRSFRATLGAAAITVLIGFSPSSFAQITGIPEIPQIPAFLPMMTDVPATDAMPIDGEWMINMIRKRIRIDGGRAYAVDSWAHLFVLKIEPLMVVLSDLQRTGPGQYRGKDLPLMGDLTATLGQDGVLNVSVAGLFGPIRYKLTPVRVDDQNWFSQEKSGNAPQYGQQPPPQYGQQPPQYGQQPPQYQQPPAVEPVIGQPMPNPDAGAVPVDPW